MTYGRLARCVDNAARIGNMTAADYFLARLAECRWVEPADWRPHVCFARGIPLHGRDLAHTAVWRTKAEAQDAARAIGWPVGEVTRVHHRLHGEHWALVDGRFGLVSRSWYRAMVEREVA